MMKSTSSASDGDFVAVDMPGAGPAAAPAAASSPDPPEHDVEEAVGPSPTAAAHHPSPTSADQRSLLQTLWTEATSTTDLPPVHTKLHHRRTTKSRRGAHGALPNASPSKQQRGGGTLLRHRYRVTRGARIANRVWLAMFAALAASFLIAIHVFLYRVFVGSHDHDINYGPVMKHGMPILGAEDREAKMTLKEAHNHKLASIHLHAMDTAQYTIRMNTWRRNEQLVLSLNHHAHCDGVKEIQVIWCDSEHDPPHEVVHHTSGKVKVEKHAINSLNERFKVLLDPPTLGILSLDDDVLRPCAALDAAFVRWTRHPERMVGFDARTHVVADDDTVEGGKKDGGTRWKYGYMSTTEKSNRYTITLPRASFVHRDYLDMYVMALPRPIYAYVATNLECEDVAMSFLVSSLTNGRPPLLADYWAVKSMVKLYSATKISGGKGHKSTRDKCVNDFAELLGLKESGEWPLQSAKLLHKDKFFGYGAEPEEWSSIDGSAFQSSRLQKTIAEMRELEASSGDERMAWLMQRKAETMEEARGAGMIEKTTEWRERWEKGAKDGG